MIRFSRAVLLLLGPTRDAWPCGPAPAAFSACRLFHHHDKENADYCGGFQKRDKRTQPTDCATRPLKWSLIYTKDPDFF